MEIICQGWKLSTDVTKTANLYQGLEEYSEIDWHVFQAKYKETVEFLTKLHIDFRRPADYSVLSESNGDPKLYELVYRFYGTAADGEYEIDLDSVNIALYEETDASGDPVVMLDVFNVWM